MRLNILLLVRMSGLTLVAVPLVKGAQKAAPLTPSADPLVRTQAGVCS